MKSGILKALLLIGLVGVGLAVFIITHKRPLTISKTSSTNPSLLPEQLTMSQGVTLESADKLRYGFRRVERDNHPSFLSVNQAQQLRLWLSEKGMTITPSAFPGQPNRPDEWSASLNLKKFGRTSQLIDSTPSFLMTLKTIKLRW